MSAANTVSIKLEVTGTPETISQLKSVVTQLQGVGTAVKQTQQAVSSGQFGLGPLKQLETAIGSAEQKVLTFRDRLKQVGQGLQQNGAAFGVATASIWGVYNAYDSLAKVEIRAHQAASRVQTTTTSLASLENRLQEARAKGNLTAEEMAILEDKIANTKQRLAVQQERNADLQQDVNEAWGAFASQIGPQVVAAAGSIAQLVTNIRGSLTGIVPALRTFGSNIGTTIRDMFSLRTQAVNAIGPIGAIGPAAALSASGIRVMSGAIKGLLISTGIGAVIVGIGLLIDAFGTLNDASANMANDTTDSFDKAAQAPTAYQSKLAESLSVSEALLREHGKTVDEITKNFTASYVQSLKNQAEADKLRAQSWVDGATVNKGIVDAEIKRLQDLEKQTGFLTDAEAERLKTLKIQSENYTITIDENTAAVKTRTTEISNYNTVLPEMIKKEEQAQRVTEGTKQLYTEMPTLLKNTRAGVIAYVESEKQRLLATGNATDAMQLASIWLKNNYGDSILLSTATDQMNTSIEALFPNQEKLAKSTENYDNKIQDLLLRAQELETKFGVDIPDSLITTAGSTEEAGRRLDALTKTIEANKDMMKKWEEIAKEFKSFDVAAKAFKIKFDMDKEVKDFIKDLPKKTEKKVEIVVEREKGQQNFHEFFDNIKSIFFRTFKRPTGQGDQMLAGIEFRPIFNDQDAQSFKKELLDKLKEIFGKDLETAPEWIKKLVGALKGAKTKEEIVKVLQDFGLLVQNELTKLAPTIGNAFWDTLLGPKQKSKTGKTEFPITSPHTVTKTGEGEDGGGGTGPSEQLTELQKQIDLAKQAFIDFRTTAQTEMKAVQTTARAFVITMNTYFTKTMGQGLINADILMTALEKDMKKSMSGVQTTARGFVITMNTYFTKTMGQGFINADMLITAFEKDSKKSMTSIQTTARGFVVTMNTYFGKTLTSGVNAATKAVNDLKSAVDKLKSKTITITVKFKGGGGGGNNKLRGEAVQSGYFGLVDEPTVFLAGEAGKENVNVKPLGGGGHLHENIGMDLGTLPSPRNTTSGIRNVKSGPTIIHLEVPVYMGNELLRKYVKEIPLADTGMFPTA